MTKVLEVAGVEHRFGDTVALDDLALDVAAGECVALLGPNGAGKTTLVNLAVGMLVRQRGTVLVGGADPRWASTRRQLGVVQQTLGFPKVLTVRELITGAAVRGGKPRSSAAPIMAELDLTKLADRRARKLSGGQQQRVQLAMALVAEPRLLILDEPTVGLDMPARRKFWEIIARRRAAGVGVLVTTHLIEETAAVADRVVVLNHGRVVTSGSPTELVARFPDRTVLARTAVPERRLAELPGVLSVRREDALVRLATREPEELLRVLLAEDPALSGLRVEGTGLAEAVLAFTGGSARPNAEVRA
ncbi:ABC-2 type transport system ATP-binding protein [Tamaricihabitans halophyticus]|uniref:ABC-2 type transport system ATP-binding protein n=1 Tax=Tamaricihabitans halophyticus TaxID=1262583 RepID=A0A4R2QXQ9_9PSEU|nr:ABC transporter ATP-binding protein [Tamaricihabitans halophyticus]TCP54943.1 ABC-2 type transport system ATP-binding protein [Tamaricihabitans halophyticus]